MEEKVEATKVITAEAKFADVLEKNETIVKVYKPNKTKFWTAFILTAFISWVWVYAILFGAFESGSFDSSLFWLLFWVSNGVFVGGMLFTILFGAIYYKNRYYAYTNKRIIIRSGIIGVDFKSLEFKTLTATIVRVTPLDKILRRNTGNLRFGSPAAPVGNLYTMNPYTFKHLVKPYDTLREIKELMNECEETVAPKAPTKK